MAKNNSRRSDATQFGISLSVCVILLGIGFLAGLFLVKFFIDPEPNDNLGPSLSQVSYADLAAITLTSVSFVVTVIGVAIAVIAFVGFGRIREMVRSLSESTSVEEVRRALQNEGPLHDEVRKSLERGGVLYELTLENITIESDLGQALVKRVHALYLTDIGPDDEDEGVDDGGTGQRE